MLGGRTAQRHWRFFGPMVFDEISSKAAKIFEFLLKLSGRSLLHDCGKPSFTNRKPLSRSVGPILFVEFSERPILFFEIFGRSLPSFTNRSILFQSNPGGGPIYLGSHSLLLDEGGKPSFKNRKPPSTPSSLSSPGVYSSLAVSSSASTQLMPCLLAASSRCDRDANDAT